MLDSAGKNKSYKVLYSKLTFVLVGILIFRLGAHIPVPGVDFDKLSDFFNTSGGSMISLFNMFSGGAFSKLTVFALGVMPYISSSIIMQLFTVSLPKFQQLKKEGDIGRRKITRYTRLGTLIIGLVQSFGVSKWLISQGLALDTSALTSFTVILTITTGTVFLMWVGEQITEHGIGNGVSLLIFSGIVSRFPGAIGQISEQVHQGQISGFFMFLVTCLALALVFFVVFFELSQRKIPITYAKQMGIQQGTGSQTHLPLKLNMAGVIPAIFASTLILLPMSLAGFFSHYKHFTWLTKVSYFISPGQPLNVLLYLVSIFFFSFFYTSLVFNPKETADNLKRSGAIIPGIRPGQPTASYIDSVMERITYIGASYLALVILLPQWIMLSWHMPFMFGGASMLIAVVVLIDFINQIQSHLLTSKYDNLSKVKKGGKKNLGILH